MAFPRFHSIRRRVSSPHDGQGRVLRAFTCARTHASVHSLACTHTNVRMRPCTEHTHRERRVNRGGRCSNAEWKTGRVDVAAVANRYKNIRHCLRCLKPVTVCSSATETLRSRRRDPLSLLFPLLTCFHSPTCRKRTPGKITVGGKRLGKFMFFIWLLRRTLMKRGSFAFE